MTQQVTLEELLGQLKRISAEWLDDDGRKVLESIPRVVDRLDSLTIDKDLIKAILVEDPYALDVFRLFLDLSQDILANEMKARGVKGDFTSIRSKCKNDSENIARILVELGVADAIATHRSHKWTLQDVLWDRYGHMRGRAMTAQKRGATLEDAVESILIELKEEIGMTFDRGGNFVNRSGEQAKADFTVPSREVPRIIIEAKGYEATGSKLTDVLGDILKVLRVKDEDSHYFFITDGIGWYRRLSDLKKIVEHHQRGNIEMIYTISTLPNLKEAIRKIMVSQ
jgi:hypothetical protein